MDQDDNPIPELPYFIIHPDGKKSFGRTNYEGKTRKIRTNGSNDIENAYNNDKDWIRKTIEVSGGLGVGFFAGSLFSTATVPLIAAVGGGLILALPLTVILIAAGIGFGIAVGYAGGVGATMLYDEIKKLKSNYKNDNFIKDFKDIYVPIYN